MREIGGELVKTEATDDELPMASCDNRACDDTDEAPMARDARAATRANISAINVRCAARQGHLEADVLDLR